MNTVADAALEEVNVFNETSSALGGTLEVTAPNGTVVLDEQFDLAGKRDDEPTAEATVAYDGVWEGAGAYGLRVELADGDSVRGQARLDTSVTVDDPAEEMLAVAFGADGEEAGIYVAVAAEFSEFT